MCEQQGQESRREEREGLCGSSRLGKGGWEHFRGLKLRGGILTGPSRGWTAWEEAVH